MTATSQSIGKSFRDQHAGVVVVALDLASPFGNAQNFANVRQMWDAAQAARREALS
jgi:hypothetical protein